MTVAQYGDTIQFSSLFATPQTINLGSTLPAIGTNLTITGPGADLLTVRANASGFTIMLINAGTVSISGVTIADGDTDFAGGINNFGSLTLIDSVITRNHASVNGGGLQNAGTLVVMGSTISDNSAGYGAGLFNWAASPTLASATLINTTFSGNVAVNFGGSIVSDNFGGTPPVVNLTNCTLADSGFASVAAVDQGGAAIVNLKNTIVANNVAPAFVVGGAGGQIASAGNNLASGTGDGFLTGSGDLTNTDPRLTALGNFGGHTPVYLLAFDSAAVDAGSGGAGAPVSDQRGVPRPQGGNLDIGAVELRPLIINSTADPGDGTCDASCTLRDALIASNSDGASANDLFFSSVFNTPRSINLASALPDITTDLTLTGPGAELLTVRRDTGGDYSVFTVYPGAFAHLSGLTIANGSGSYGAGVNNFGTLAIERSTLTANVATTNGGALQNLGSLIVSNSTVSGNSAGYGAGLFNYSVGACSCSASVTNTTFSGNQGGTYSGGIINVNFGGSEPVVRITNSTIAGNSAVAAAGIYLSDQGGVATVILKNTILAGNQSQNVGTYGANTHFISLGHNLADDNAGGFLAGIGDLTSTNPLLAVLSNYGGTTKTLFLKRGSPAINTGDDSGAPATDQRGVARPQGTHVDIGAIESDGELLFQNGLENP